MKRPIPWFRALAGALILLLLLEYAALTWFAPRYVLQMIRWVGGGEVTAETARLAFPFTTELGRLRLVSGPPEAVFNIQRTILRPGWVSLLRKTLWLRSVEVDRPLLRVTRTRDGTVLWPSLTAFLPGGAAAAASRRPGVPGSGWRVNVERLNVTDGTIEFIDERVPGAFHAVFDHVSFEAGPLVLPFDGAQTSVAVRGEFIGHGGHAAPFYCSGWFDLTKQDVEASCQNEPLALAAFTPYYGQAPTVRVYSVKLHSTSQWTARSNELTAKIQLELSDLHEGDLSFRGRTFIDVKQLAAGPDARLRGEIGLEGPLNRLAQWHAHFIPGDLAMQGLVSRLLERDIEVLGFWCFGQRVALSLVPASEQVMQDIVTKSKEIQDALEILSAASVAPEQSPLELAPDLPAEPAADSPSAPSASPPGASEALEPLPAPEAGPLEPDAAPAVPLVPAGS